MSKKKLVTSALPYVNNVPHLGNLIQVLSADVFARFCRSRGYDTLYVCGTDEYGTATETRAAEEGKTPAELCDFYHKIHKKIYKWFEISFDHFGRTSAPAQTEIVQEMFLDLDKNGFISEDENEQLFCEKCGRFLADRYIRGICPQCGSDAARGDQCEKCGKLLDPTELKEPKCSTCGETPVVKKTRHLYIDLPAIQKHYAPWMSKASTEGRWAKNAVQMTESWIRDGLQKRAITRDLKWGIPVPKAGFENKVFYVWFDAPIGYISITKELADSSQGRPYQFRWEDWWLPQNDDVELFQFIGKDNIPFHTVIFPSTLIGSGKNWTKLHHMSSSEYLNYENSKFSKSKGIGVFGTDAVESGIPADVWRFYIFYSRPEKSDAQFTWKDFQDKVNSELVGNLANLINRTVTFITRYFDGKIPEGKSDEKLWAEVRKLEDEATELLEWANLRDAFHKIFEISAVANKAFQDAEPWKAVKENPQNAAGILRDLCLIIKDLMIMTSPFMPDYASRVMGFFGKKLACGTIHNRLPGLSWEDLGKQEGVDKVLKSEIIFKPMDDASIAAWRERYSGNLANRSETKAESQPKTEEKSSKPKTDEELQQFFASKIALKVAQIVNVENHPDADKLYVETLDDGSGSERVILSGLVPYMEKSELLNRKIIIADNLKPRKMRGIESRGMLLAADWTKPDGSPSVELLDPQDAPVGTLLELDGIANGEKPAEISVDDFFTVPITLQDGVVYAAGKKLLCNGKEIRTVNAKSGEIS